VKRYVAAGAEAGLVRDGNEAKLTDGVRCASWSALTPPDGHGSGWVILRTHHEQLKVWPPSVRGMMATELSP
jgi:hypothetical protein